MRTILLWDAGPCGFPNAVLPSPLYALKTTVLDFLFGVFSLGKSFEAAFLSPVVLSAPCVFGDTVDCSWQVHRPKSEK